MQHLLGKKSSELAFSDFERLVSEGEAWREGRFWDFKESLPSREPTGAKDPRREFLADVSSFANSDGGALVIGIAAPRGVPIRLTGVPVGEVEAQVLRLQSLARDHLDPPLTRVIPHIITGPSDLAFLVLEIPRSLLGPHAVWLDRDGRFWKRSTSGKYQMDIHELRQAFSQADRWLDEASALRRDRVQAIAQGLYTPYALPSGFSSIVLHSIPLGRNRHRLELDSVAPLWRDHFVPDSSFPVYRYRYTFEGGLVFANDGNEQAALVSCLRTGVVEQCIALHRRYAVPGSADLIDGCRLQADIGYWLEAIFKWQQSADLEPPIAVFVSLLSVNGRGFVANAKWAGLGTTCPRFDVRDIELPEVILNDHSNSEWSRAVGELVLLLWQTAGLPASPCSG